MNVEKTGRLILLAVMVPFLLGLVWWGTLSLRDHWNMVNDNGANNCVVVMTSDYEAKVGYMPATLRVAYEYEGDSYQDVKVLPNSTKPIFEGFDVDAMKGPNGRKPIKVFVNKSNPREYSLLSPTTSIGREDHLTAGAVVLSLALSGLYFCLRREPRLQDLIPESWKTSPSPISYYLLPS